MERKMFCRAVTGGVLFIATTMCGAVRAADRSAESTVHDLTTPDGTRFAILGDKPAAPAPTLLVFGGDQKGTLLGEDVNRIGRLLAPHGFLSVSLDIPCHGADARPGEQGGLTGWRDRIVKGEHIFDEFAKRVSQTLDYLIAEKYTDPERIVISGTSRGGFCAFHAAAADERIRYVLAFAPVTHLPVLTEFEGAREHSDVLALSPIHFADKLANRTMWMVIGNDDERVGTDDCIALTQAILKHAKRSPNPIPVELHVLATIDHRLHAMRKPEYKQWTSPHDDAAAWLLAVMAPSSEPAH